MSISKIYHPFLRIPIGGSSGRKEEFQRTEKMEDKKMDKLKRWTGGLIKKCI
tara:strand:+ start:333 stop:488 length:156 start_codon:yes stop_codon:yes gene_type:complete